MAGVLSTDGAVVVVVVPAGGFVVVASAEAVVGDVVEVVVGDVVEVVVVESVEALAVDVAELAVGAADAAMVLRLPTVRNIPAAVAFRANDGRNGSRRR